MPEVSSGIREFIETTSDRLLDGTPHETVIEPDLFLTALLVFIGEKPAGYYVGGSEHQQEYIEGFGFPSVRVNGDSLLFAATEEALDAHLAVLQQAETASDGLGVVLGYPDEAVKAFRDVDLASSVFTEYLEEQIAVGAHTPEDEAYRRLFTFYAPCRDRTSLQSAVELGKQRAAALREFSQTESLPALTQYLQRVTERELDFVAQIYSYG